MAIENPSVLYLEQSLSPEQKTVVCENIGAVRTIAGKGLSTEDFTTAEKNKLSDVESGAEANVIEAITVNSESTTISSKTVNIPAATASTGGAGGTSGVMTPSDKEKLDGLVSNVQSDWNAASGSAAEILNKPTIPTVDQTYDGTSTNAQSGVAVASAISEIDEVPTVGSNDNGKVLKASYSGGVGSFSWQLESGGTTYTAGDGIDISAQDVISAKVDGTSITVNASHELTTSAEANVIEGVKLDGAASVLTPDASKNVTIPNAVATGETGATNGLMTADDKKSLGTAVQCKVNPTESGTPVLLAQQIYVVESDDQIISIAGQSSEINGKGTLFFRIGTAVT